MGKPADLPVQDEDLKPELSSRAISTFALYFENTYGRARLERAYARLGTNVPLEYALDAKNWVSFDFSQRLLKLLAEESEDPEFTRKAGYFTMSPRALGFLYYMLRAFGSPKMAYEKLIGLGPTFNRCGHFSVDELSTRHLILRYRSDREEGNRNLCQTRMAQFAALPTIWGLPPAEMKELQCQVNGAPECIYEYRWYPNPKSVLSGALSLTIGIALGLALLHTAFGWLGAGGVGLLFGAAVSLALGYRAESIRKSQILQEHGEGLAASMRDLQARFEEIQQLNATLEERVKQRTQELSTAHEQLKRLDHFKSQFFANITHELKTPLVMILSPLDLMLHGETGEIPNQQRAALTSMFRSGMKLLKLIGDILDLSKVEESRLRLRITEHDLAGQLRGLVAEAAPLAERKGIEIGFHANCERCVVWGDGERLERVFLNLLSNAIKFTGSAGHVQVRLEDGGEGVRIEVSDDGPGFPPEMAERIFERFFQVDMEGTRKYGGTGIGLALARELVLLHGGTIHAVSKTEGGATFIVELKKDREHFDPNVLDRRLERRDRPGGRRESDGGLADWTADLTARREFRLLDVDEVTERRVLERDAGEQQRTHTVLVVEDNLDVTRLIHMALRHQFKVLAAADGRKGLALAQRELPDLIITDLMMPEMDGMELTRRLRDDPTTSRIPILMLTARDDVADRVSGLDSGANAYLTKPFFSQELLATARSLCHLTDATTDLVITERVDSLQMIARGLAHEVNNPLNYLKNSLLMIRRDCETLTAMLQATGAKLPPDETWTARAADLQKRTTRMFTTAEAGVKRIGRAVDLVRNFTRDGYHRAPQPCDVFAVIGEIVDIIVPATGRDVKVELFLEGNGHIECVPEELTQALTNVLQNAIEAVPEGTGHVEVVGRPEDDYVVVCVRDNGPGIKPEHRLKIFSPFFTTKEPGQGMGLGLAFVHHVIQGLGGQIYFDSTPGTGTEFVFRLPRNAHVASERRGAIMTPADGRAVAPPQ